MSHNFAALVTVLAVFLQLGMMVGAGRARGKYGVKAPATTGHEGFERAFRVQMNTLESTAMFLPALWVFAFYVGDMWAGIVGAAWLIGRVVYAVSYNKDPAKRGVGFTIGLASIAVLAVGGLIGVVRVLIA